MTEIKEIESTQFITVYIMMKLTRDGNFSELKPTFGTHKILGGLWSSKEEVQHEQMMLALKDEQYRIFEVKWAL
jgi:hypothetical protein